MNRTPAEVRTAEEKPKYTKTAAALLERCRAWYLDPENEKEYEEWKERRRKGE